MIKNPFLLFLFKELWIEIWIYMEQFGIIFFFFKLH